MQNQIHSQTVCLFPLQEIKHTLSSICSFTAEKAKNVLKEDEFLLLGLNYWKMYTFTDIKFWEE